MLVVFFGQTQEFYSFEPGYFSPGLSAGGLRICVLLRLDWNEFPLQRVRIVFQNQFYEENKHGIVKSNIFSLRL